VDGSEIFASYFLAVDGTKMTTGHLGLPLVGPAGHQSIALQAVPIGAYYQVAQKHPVAASLRQKLGADSRFTAINGKMLNTGSGWGLLQIEHVVAWFLFRANEVSPESAEAELETFLASSTIELLATLWVYGVTTKTVVKLFDGIELVPRSQMPWSQERYDFERSEFSFQAHNLPSPQAALIKRVTVPKIYQESSERKSAPEHSVQSELRYVSILMNALSKTCCMSGYQTFYKAEGTPTGPFGGGGGGTALYDLLPRKRLDFDPEHADTLRVLFQSFQRLNNTQKTTLETALHRLAQAKGRIGIGDSSLDLGIALEMVLLNNEHGGQELPGQLNLHFRLRGSWLIAETKEERLALYKTLGRIYSLRSQIAHNGYSKELLAMSHTERDAMIALHISAAERIIQKLIRSGTPTDWASVILGE
jgi:hypothetical protein